MRRSTEFIIGLAIVLVAGGGILFCVMMTLLGWDFTRLGNEDFVQKNEIISDEIKDISIRTGDADIYIVPSDEETVVVSFDVPEKAKCGVSTEGNTLTIHYEYKREMMGVMNFSFRSAKITVYVPEKEYNSLNIKGSTSDVDCRDFHCDTINVTTSTGDVTMDGVTCRNLSTDANTGDLKLKNVRVENELVVERSTGDVEFKKLELCGSGKISTSTGDVEGTFANKVDCEAKSKTGSIKVPDVDSKVTCRITTSTGDISVKE